MCGNHYLVQYRGPVSDPNRADEDESRSWKLLDVASRRPVLRRRVGPGPDAEKADAGAVPERG